MISVTDPCDLVLPIMLIGRETKWPGLVIMGYRHTAQQFNTVMIVARFG